MKPHCVGIDLGTTNSALAYIRPQERPEKTTAMPVPQLIQPDQASDRSLLPSFGYLVGEGEFPAGTGQLPWGPSGSEWIGEVARGLGARIPGRLVHSAKSWLAHPRVDPDAPLLPWQAPEGQRRISPVAASTAYLAHLAAAWDHQFQAAKTGIRLANQRVVITVPASFDDSARRWTHEAAKRAGLGKAGFIEEPLAAFYAWMAENPGIAADFEPGMTVLVVDVGGGTTDFTLIGSISDKGELAWTRLAVGDHLLLGGDNMDLALAHAAETRLGARLDGVQMAQLVQVSRSAKEKLLAAHGPEDAVVTVTGRGRALMGGTLTAKLTREDIQRVILDGFFPKSGPTEIPAAPARAGIQEAGLPYARDPGITRHLAAFLARHLPAGKMPDAILFNGGVFHPPVLRDRLMESVRGWRSAESEPKEIRCLVPGSLDLAVARGAAHYAWLKETGGKRIGGGSARSYYVGLGADGAADEKAAQPALLCVLARQSEEGELVLLEKPELELALGEPVRFPLYSATTRPRDKPGDLIRPGPDELLAQGDLQTRLRGGKRSGAKTLKVRLGARPTEIGTLELELKGPETDQAWKLEFSLRAPVEGQENAAGQGDEVQETIDDSLVNAAKARLETALVSPDRDAIKGIVKSIEEALGQPRSDWPVTACRRLWESLSQNSEGRKLTPEHFERWVWFSGWCLRPGQGMPGDEHRLESLWKLLYGPAVGKPREGGTAWWVMWRRVAGGLDEARQTSLFERFRGVLLPVKGRTLVKPPPGEIAEMWRLAASLERLDQAAKVALAEPLLKLARKPQAPEYVFWSLARLGTRAPLHGPLNTILPGTTVAQWIDVLVEAIRANPERKSSWSLPCFELLQTRGDRQIDLPEADAQRLKLLIESEGLGPELADLTDQLSQAHPRADWERKAKLLGDALPLGLRLAGPA